MTFRLAHTNINVTELEKSIAFYKEALGLTPIRRHKAPDGTFEIAFLGDGQSDYSLEMTWLRDKQGKYDLGDNESHIAFIVDDYASAHALHEKMGCISFENKAMGLYFIEDPDGYWLEIIPAKR